MTASNSRSMAHAPHRPEGADRRSDGLRQTEIQKDLADARAAPAARVWEAKDVAIHDFDASARVSYSEHATREIACDFIAGCDGYHGVTAQRCEGSISCMSASIRSAGWAFSPTSLRRRRTDLRQSRARLLACSMRSRTRSRYYCSATGRSYRQLSYERFWTNCDCACADYRRACDRAVDEKSIAALRSFVAEPMRSAAVLVGDAGISCRRQAPRTELAPPMSACSTALVEYYVASETLLEEFARALARCGSHTILVVVHEPDAQVLRRTFASRCSSPSSTTFPVATAAAVLRRICRSEVIRGASFSAATTAARMLCNAGPKY